jgi:hypothetical protein
MKILFCHDGCPDYGIAMLWEGLIRNLGYENVIDYPILESFHNGTAWQWLVTQREKRTEQIDVGGFDVIVASDRQIDFVYDLNRGQLPVVLCNFSDSRWPPYNYEKVKPILLLQRDYILNVQYPDICRPFPFSLPSNLSCDPKQDRDIDVFASWQITNYSLRQRVGDMIKALPFKVVYMEQGLHWQKYWELLCRSKIGVCVRGFGHDSVRFNEIAAAGAMVFADETPHVKPYPFLEACHAAYFNESNFYQLISHYVNDSNARLSIAERGHNHFKQFHTCEMRAYQLLQMLQEIL